ncbi:MAG: peptidoglycan-binding protein [Candidatus Sungbacteria bacterium]|nr:peptidoglycan-binding protein [Candidatus Sungbacteria bacterium]
MFTTRLILAALAALSAIALFSDQSRSATFDEISSEISKIQADVASVAGSSSTALRAQVLANAQVRLSTAFSQLRDIQLEAISREVASTSAAIAEIRPGTATSTRDRILASAASQLSGYLPQLMQFKFGGSTSAVLSLGSRGAAVVALQQTLARDTSIYPQGLVTGYYGPLTQAAVARFQARYSLAASGAINSATLAKLVQVYGPQALAIGSSGSTGTAGTPNGNGSVNYGK